MRTNAITEGAMASALFAVLLLLAFYVPLISILAVWVLPLPFVMYVIRNGLRPGLVLWLASFVVALLVVGVLGPFWALMFGGGGLVTGWLYRQKRSAFSVLLGGSLAYTASIIVVFIFSVVFLKVNIIDQYLQLLTDALNNAEQMSESLGSAEGDRLEALKQQVDLLRYFAPFLFVFAGVVFALVTQLIAAPILRRIGLGRYVKPWVPFREWCFPKSFIWYYLIVLLIGVFQNFSPGSPGFAIYYNVLMILEMVMAIQGFSFIFFYFHMKKVNISVPIIIVVVSFLFSSVLPLLSLVRILGIVDLGFDLRKRMYSK